MFLFSSEGMFSKHTAPHDEYRFYYLLLMFMLYLSSAPSFVLRFVMSLFITFSICLSLRVLLSSCRMKFTA